MDGAAVIKSEIFNIKGSQDIDLSYSILDCKARALTEGTEAAAFKKLLRSKMNEMFPIRHG